MSQNLASASEEVDPFQSPPHENNKNLDINDLTYQ